MFTDVLSKCTQTQTQRQTQGHKVRGTQRKRDTKKRGHKEKGTQRYRDTKTQGHKDTGTQRHGRDTKTQEGHKDTGVTQRHGRERLPTDISGGLKLKGELTFLHMTHSGPGYLGLRPR